MIERIDYLNDGHTAFVHIPFEEIHEYSNEYNPTMLVIDEMRQVTGVDVAIGIKTYPDDKLTGKIRSNIPVSNLLAKRFGGDGHCLATGKEGRRRFQLPLAWAPSIVWFVRYLS